MTAKKVLFWISLTFIILAAFGEATTLQLLPLVAIAGILSAEIWAKKKLQVWALVISIIMLVANFLIVSPIDIIFWIASIIIFSRKSLNK